MSLTWKDFQAEGTVTSLYSEKGSNKTLPCLTFCPYPIFKEPIYPLSVKEFEAQAYHLEDIFTNATVREMGTELFNLLQLGKPN